MQGPGAGVLHGHEAELVGTTGPRDAQLGAPDLFQRPAGQKQGDDIGLGQGRVGGGATPPRIWGSVLFLWGLSDALRGNYYCPQKFTPDPI